ncbi:E3 ubiquitin-protein ligase RMA3-like [Momordica charantia]|uniref:E3 ubiquitin-protein ligase RMA n=1 Tax=Momordica charantia TaxID=3673 RepID=A0A6J1CDN1_MOMCH|nr:E3 ubiquitin-protein ligase RMA3-like [Momordica charantia]
MEQTYTTPEAYFESEQDVSLKQNWKSISSQPTVSDDAHGCFDCNICLDSAAEPVVTLCGHLYCWPCIYKWLNVQISSNEPENVQNCPVCKASITPSSLVPLYGRGKSNTDSESKKSHLGVAVPRRPPPSATNTLHNSNATSALHPSQDLHPNYTRSPSHPIYHQQYFPQAYGDIATYTPSYLGNAVITSLLNPTIGMFGETVFTRIFGSVDSNLLPYPPYNNSIPGNGSSRMRRQEMQLDKSLNRVSIFLFCCFIICLLLF